MLANTAEANNPQTLEMHKLGLELWILLKYYLERASLLNVISILESIRNTQAAKHMQDVISKVKPSKDDIKNHIDKLQGQRSQSWWCLPQGDQESGLGENASWRNSQGVEEEHERRLILRYSRRGFDNWCAST